MKSSNSTQKWLFVCSRNKRRSLTAEKMLEKVDGLEVRSAGTQPGARVALSAGLIGWADLIFWMEKSHLNRARQRFPEEIDQRENVVLGIPDDFEFGQIELIEELRAKLEPFIEWPE
ncbi:putative protein tyrosine phosphatase [Abditibacterium utsteinense]|uniref:Phosphotyrosine protein phosphatase I domain-containing protein n=1 Tax=Abditibacterium utsteinense TaxID=1960156 RepID=A0A2S8SSS8_9BACT|nr:protein tyrosine phosphatase [Abditibacterium utsteinense]PQV63860.1 putative protein tyrosine phosphatase [Abditibacterium utsteinense]